MALIEKKVIDKIEIVSEYKHIQIRYANQIVDDATGDVKASTYERTVCMCGDTSTATANGVADIASVVWTAEIIQAHKNFQAANPGI